MHNLLEYSENYSITSRILWNYYRNEVNDSANKSNDANNYIINNNKTITSKLKKIWRTPDDNNLLDAEVVVPLKHLNDFWRLFDLPLFNCETELDLRWTIYCIISEISRAAPVAGDNPVTATETKGAIFEQITLNAMSL